MKLLLDEHFARLIATKLRDAGHDVESVEEHGLKGTDDPRLLEIAREWGRVLVTNNVQDFVPLEREWIARGEIHQGIIYTVDGSVPRATNQSGEMLTRLTRELERHPDDDALRGRSIFLSP